MYTRRRVRRNTAGPAYFDGHRRRPACRSSARRSTPFACRSIPTSWPSHQIGSTRSNGLTTGNINLRPGRLEATSRRSSSSPAAVARMRPPTAADRSLAQRVAGPAGTIGERHRQRPERQTAAWYNSTPRHRPGDSKTARHQHRRGSGLTSARCCLSSEPIPPSVNLRSLSTPPNPFATRSRRGDHAGADGRRGGPGDFPVPA